MAKAHEQIDREIDKNSILGVLGTLGTSGVSKGSNIIAALLSGFYGGTVLDEEYGLSERIARRLVPDPETRTGEEHGRDIRLLKSINEYQKAVTAGENVSSGRYLTQEDRDFFADENRNMAETEEGPTILDRIINHFTRAGTGVPGYRQIKK